MANETFDDFASEWIKVAMERDVVYLQPDQVRLDWSGRPVILSDLGIAATVEEIKRTKVWKKECAAFAMPLHLSTDTPVCGHYAVMVNGNHRLLAILEAGLVLPEGIPVRLGPPLRSEDERCIVAAKLNEMDYRFRKYSATETLLAMDSVAARLLASGRKVSCPAMRALLLGDSSGEAHRMMDRWYTVWGELFSKKFSVDERMRLRAWLRRLSGPDMSDKIKWKDLRLGKKNTTFEEREAFLGRLLRNFSGAESDNDPGEESRPSTPPNTAAEDAEQTPAEDREGSTPARVRRSGRQVSTPPAIAPVRPSPRKKRRKSEWGRRSNWYPKQPRTRRDRVVPTKKSTPSKPDTAESSTDSTGSSDAGDHFDARFSPVDQVGFIGGCESLRPELARYVEVVRDGSRRQQHFLPSQRESIEDTVISLAQDLLNRLWE